MRPRTSWEDSYSLDAETGVFRPRGGTTAFDYSDGGDFEARLAEIIGRARDRSVFSAELSAEITDWPSRYHLSALRANLLRPVESLFRGRTLELGAGCGAVTRYLGEVGGSVVALEGSPRRAAIAAARCRDLPNVRVCSDRIQDFPREQAFDVVTLVGVLEWSRRFGAGADPVQDVLERAASLLTDDGVLVLAIENQLGLKYFAGFVEDHIGVPMFGINDLYDSGTVVTFGRRELERRLSQAGFSHSALLVPIPDYKLATTVVTPAGLLDPGWRQSLAALLAASTGADAQQVPVPLFSLERAWDLIVRNGLVGDCANSFLVVASRRQPARQAWDPTLLGVHYGGGRAPQYLKATAFHKREGGLEVKRTRYASHGVAKDGAPIRQRLVDEPYLEGSPWLHGLSRIVNRPGWTVAEAAVWARRWIDAVLAEAAVEGAGIETPLPGRLLDATPYNLVVDRDASMHFIDLEWESDTPLTLGFLFFRGMLHSLAHFRSVARPEGAVPIHHLELIEHVGKSLGLLLTRSDVERYAELELEIQSWVQGSRSGTDLGGLQRAELQFRPELAAVEAMSARLAAATEKQARSAALLGEATAELDRRERESAAQQERAAAELSRLERESAAHLQQAQQRERELVRIQSGVAWSLLMRYRRLNEKLLPPGSLRRRLYLSMLGSGRAASAPPKPRLAARLRFAAQKVKRLAGVARMVVRTQGTMQLFRFAGRKFVRWREERHAGSPGAEASPPLQRAVAVVIPTYNQTTLVADCVDSIWRSLLPESRPFVRIVVVDDGSSAAVRAALKELEAEVLLNPANKGFAGGVNDGLATLLPGEDAIILNNDTLAHAGWIEALQECALAHARVGIVGPKLLYPDGRIQSAGSYRSVGAPEWFDHCFRFTPASHLPANVQREVLAVTGACMYVKREVVDAIGSFDPEYPMAYEDVDYCLRAREAGFQILYTPRATLTHLEGHTRGERKEPRELVSQERFWRKWGAHFEGRRVWNERPERLSIVYVMQDTGVGGGARVVFEQLNRLAERGHDVALYALAERPKWFPLATPVKTFANYEDLVAGLAQQDAIKVATWWETGEPVWRSSLTHGIPVFLVQDIETSYYGSEHALEQAKVVASYRKEFHYFCDATWTRAQLQELGVAARVVAPGIDQVYRQLGLPRERDVVLSLGRGNPLKNFEMLAKAFPRVQKTAKLWLFGIEPNIGRGLASQYAFAPTDAQVAELYNKASVFVLTSRHEGFGLPILEAMACGCPVVCTNADGNMDFCRDGENCLMVPQGDEAALAAALDRLLGDESLQDRLREAGLTTAKEYTWEKAIANLEDFYRGIARERSRRLPVTAAGKLVAEKA